VYTVFAGIPCVASFHTDILDLFRTHNANWFQKFCIVFKERVDSFVLDSCATTSQSFSKKLALQGLTCEHIIITGVDSHMFSPRKRRAETRQELMFGNPSGFLCVYCGRISREKRLDVILAAVRAVPGAYLAIVGDGPMAAHYAELHGEEHRLYCRPRFLDHHELAEVRGGLTD
jgi:glycosyltransferase involved in cell wall biosynthesis